jgi:glycerol-3-phosphate acyltransferase PlsY
MIISLLIAIAVGYLLGSIPAGVLITRKFSDVDVRKYGSGSTGATNVLRTAGLRAAALVFIADMAKGSAAVLTAAWIVGSRILTIGELTFDAQSAQVLAGIFAILGHNWSLFLKLQGGKGVATFFGALLTLSPLVGVICGGVTIIVIALSHYVSLGSILGAACATFLLLPLTYLGWQPENYLIYALPSMALIIFQHRDNIYRLLAGTERKLGEPARPLWHS